MIITIDGPAGAGKSTVARGLAKRLGFEFLDTGAMYRSIAWACLRDGVDPDDGPAVTRVAHRLELLVREDSIRCDGQDVTQEIRSPEVSRAASHVAAFPGVRDALVRLQRTTAEDRNVVTEGRDQGSVVFPDAECKFFLTADPGERARRRLHDLDQQGQPGTFDDVLAQIIDRDNRDQTRAIAPLVRPDDAIEVDTSGQTAAQVIDALEQIARQRAGRQP